MYNRGAKVKIPLRLSWCMCTCRDVAAALLQQMNTSDEDGIERIPSACTYNKGEYQCFEQCYDSEALKPLLFRDKRLFKSRNCFSALT